MSRGVSILIDALAILLSALVGKLGRRGRKKRPVVTEEGENLPSNK